MITTKEFFPAIHESMKDNNGDPLKSSFTKSEVKLAKKKGWVFFKDIKDPEAAINPKDANPEDANPEDANPEDAKKPKSTKKTK